MDADRTHIDQQFADICENRIHLDPVTTRISHIADAPHLSQKQQFTLLSTISNYHWVIYHLLTIFRKLLKGEVAGMCHILCHGKEQKKTGSIFQDLPAKE